MFSLVITVSLAASAPPSAPAPPPSSCPCPAGEKCEDSSDRCTPCDPGSFQNESSSRASECTSCPDLTYQDDTGQTSCKSCDVPTCAKELVYCHPRTGQEANFTYWDVTEAVSKLCGRLDPNDSCDVQEWCIPVRRLSLKPLRDFMHRHAQSAGLRHASRPVAQGAAQCMGWDAPRHTMLLGNVCPDLQGDGVHVTAACWDQLTAEPYEDGRARESLLYATDTSSFTAVLPGTLNTTCRAAPVEARYEVYFTACRPNTPGCLDEVSLICARRELWSATDSPRVTLPLSRK